MCSAGEGGPFWGNGGYSWLVSERALHGRPSSCSSTKEWCSQFACKLWKPWALHKCFFLLELQKLPSCALSRDGLWNICAFPVLARHWVLLSCCISISMIWGGGIYSKVILKTTETVGATVLESVVGFVYLSSARFATKYSHLRGLLWREGSTWAGHRLTDEEAQILSSFASKQNLNLRLHLKLHPRLASCSSPSCFPTHGDIFFLITCTQFLGQGSASGINYFKQSQQT